MQRTWDFRLSFITWLCCLSLSGPALAEAPREIHVPAGPLVTALESLQRQASIELVYRPEELNPYRTGGVSGTYSPQEAVRILLEQGVPADEWLLVNKLRVGGVAGDPGQLLATGTLEMR